MQSVRPKTGITVTIDHPTGGSNVPGNGAFHCYGRCDPSDCTFTATATDGTNNFNGTAITPPPGKKFAFSFTGCTVGVPLTVKVTATDSGGSNFATVTFTCTNP